MRFQKKIRGTTLVEVMMAMTIGGIVIAGIIQGHLFSALRLEWIAYSQAAQNSAFQRGEQVRAARWDGAAYPVIDELTTSNFPQQIVKLDIPTTQSNLYYATNTVSIKEILGNVSLRLVTIECEWSRRNGIVYTNSLAFYRCEWF